MMPLLSWRPVSFAGSFVGEAETSRSIFLLDGREMGDGAEVCCIATSPNSLERCRWCCASLARPKNDFRCTAGRLGGSGDSGGSESSELEELSSLISSFGTVRAGISTTTYVVFRDVPNASPCCCGGDELTVSRVPWESSSSSESRTKPLSRHPGIWSTSHHDMPFQDQQLFSFEMKFAGGSYAGMGDATAVGKTRRAIGPRFPPEAENSPRGMPSREPFEL